MDKYLYVAMTGASQNALAQKAHANNLANISTNGFQRDLEQARSMPVFGDSFPARAFAMSERPATDFTPGSLVQTGRDLDVAVTGTLSRGALEQVDILGSRRTLQRFDERLQGGGMSGRNVYWADPVTGFIWKSRQHLAPGRVAELTQLKPYRTAKD